MKAHLFCLLLCSLSAVACVEEEHEGIGPASVTEVEQVVDRGWQIMRLVGGSSGSRFAERLFV